MARPEYAVVLSAFARLSNTVPLEAQVKMAIPSPLVGVASLYLTVQPCATAQTVVVSLIKASTGIMIAYAEPGPGSIVPREQAEIAFKQSMADEKQAPSGGRSD